MKCEHFTQSQLRYSYKNICGIGDFGGKWIKKVFTASAPLGRFSHWVAKSWCVSVCAIGCSFFWGLSLACSRGRRRGGSLHKWQCKWHLWYIFLKFFLANIYYYDAYWRICYQISGFPALIQTQKIKTTLPVPVVHACSTFINTCWTKLNDAGLFGRPITFRMRGKYVAGSRCHLFIYFAMIYNLCSLFKKTVCEQIQEQLFY